MTDPGPDARRARARVTAGAALVLVLLGLGIAVLATMLAPRGSTSVVEGRSAPPPAETTASATGMLLVHVLGAVHAPGLYELPEGARAIDAIAAAGGLTDAAEAAGVNLARPVADGEQLVVPEVGQAPPAGEAGLGAGGKVNLNTADAAALETLPRVGPALAERIIAWREANGPFTVVEDLLDVEGIGEKTLDAFRDLVTT